MWCSVKQWGFVVGCLVLAGCCPESSETEDEHGTTTRTSTTTTTECGSEIVECPEAEVAGADLEGRCDEKFDGSQPCFWRPGIGGCGYPPPNALPVSTFTCDGETVELWCCAGE